MTTFILYIIGFVLSYYSFRYDHKISCGLDWEWGDVRTTILISLFSWCALSLFLIIKICRIITKKWKKYYTEEKSSKPPKWL